VSGFSACVSSVSLGGVSSGGGGGSEALALDAGAVWWTLRVVVRAGGEGEEGSVWAWVVLGVSEEAERRLDVYQRGKEERRGVERGWTSEEGRGGSSSSGLGIEGELRAAALAARRAAEIEELVLGSGGGGGSASSEKEERDVRRDTAEGKVRWARGLPV